MTEGAPFTIAQGLKETIALLLFPGLPISPNEEAYEASTSEAADSVQFEIVFVPNPAAFTQPLLVLVLMDPAEKV
jgi:hypothetical protein